MSAGYWVNQNNGANIIRFTCIDGGEIHVDYGHILWLRRVDKDYGDYYQIATKSMVFNVSFKTYEAVLDIMKGTIHDF